MRNIDLRSDTVTRPTDAMRRAIAEAEVGDDVYGEDPTVNRLEARAAEMLGLEAALLVASGTQGNLLGLLSHCQRGDEYICGQYSHSYLSEGGGAAVLGSIQPQPLEIEPDGSLDLNRVEAAIKPVDNHYVRTKLLCLENTIRGKALSLEYMSQAARLARARGLGLHLDGARVFNAAIKLGVPAKEFTAQFDTVTFCLSKGLGAPVGSVLCGSLERIESARRWRKVIGGGMRQAGVLAAAGLLALDRHIDRLADDHSNARRLAEGLAEIDTVGIDLEDVHTNMVFVRIGENRVSEFVSSMRECGILVSRRHPLRLVTHLDVSRDDVDVTIGEIKGYFG